MWLWESLFFFLSFNVFPFCAALELCFVPVTYYVFCTLEKKTCGDLAMSPSPPQNIERPVGLSTRTSEYTLCFSSPYFTSFHGAVGVFLVNYWTRSLVQFQFFFFFKGVWVISTRFQSSIDFPPGIVSAWFCGGRHLYLGAFCFPDAIHSQSVLSSPRGFVEAAILSWVRFYPTIFIT